MSYRAGMLEFESRKDLVAIFGALVRCSQLALVFTLLLLLHCRSVLHCSISAQPQQLAAPAACLPTACPRLTSVYLFFPGAH